MLRCITKNISQQYYREEYTNSSEIKTLKRSVKSNLELLEYFKDKLDKEFSEHLVKDISVPSWFDRCVSFSFEDKATKEKTLKI